MVLPVIELSVVPVASKNTRNGEIPAPRTALAFNDSEPFVAEQDEPVGGVELTLTVTDWVAVPPAPVQLSV